MMRTTMDPRRKTDPGRQPSDTIRGFPIQLLGSAAMLPVPVVDNQHFVDRGLETSDEWIVSRTGIRQRRFAPPDDEVVDLATEAAMRALEDAAVPPADIGLVVVATSSTHLRMPATACLVQAAIEAERAAAFDVNAACAGFVTAMDIALRYTTTSGQRALVIGADCASRLVDPQDRLTSIFFGDGAGAVVIGHAEHPTGHPDWFQSSEDVHSGSEDAPPCILAAELHSRGNESSLHVPSDGCMTMDGRAVWEFATSVVPETVRSLCRQGGVEVSDLSLVVPHQSNQRMLEAIAEELALPFDRFAVNLERYGNTVAASIPIALHEARMQGRAGPGDLIVLIGFGAGLSWGGQLWRM